MRTATLAVLLSLFVPISQAQFIPEPAYTVSGQELSNFLAKGDFNHDGKLDVLLSGDNLVSPAPELLVFPGNGKGGFGTAIITTISGLNSPSIILAGDVNGDGIPDVVITGTDPVTGVSEFGVMLADGTDGKFKAPIFTRASVGGGQGSIVLGDFNNDKKVDVVVLGDPIVFFPGNGDGTFGSAVSSTVAGGSSCSATADFNKDGNLDITTGNEVLLGNGNGTFQAPIEVVNGRCSVAVGDFNNDGIPDLVTGDAMTVTRVRVFLGDGTGDFKTSRTFQTGNEAAAGLNGLVVDFFSGGTDADIAVSNPLSDDVTMLLGNGTGKFTIGRSFAVSTGGIISGDFNGDKKIDLAVQLQQGISLLLGIGNGTFVAQTAQNVPRTFGTIHLGNFTGNGKASLLQSGDPAGGDGSRAPTAVLPGNGDGTFGTPIPAPASCQTENAIVGDFNGDKIPDIAFSVSGSGSGVAVCLGNGDGTFKDAVISDAGVQHGLLAVGDFNHDGKLDLAASDTGGISILLGNGDGTFQNGIATALSDSSFPTFTVGDFNNDGKLDVAALASGISVLLGNGNGTFQAPITTANQGSLAITSGLINSDKNLDLVTVSGRALYIFLGNGNGTFQAPTSMPVRCDACAGNHAPLLGDVNGDGKLDLLFFNPGGLLVVFLGNGDGTFQTRKTSAAPNAAHNTLAAADVNGDGSLDAVLYSPGTGGGLTNPLGTLIVYLNQGK
jgi:hypothetical protein